MSDNANYKSPWRLLNSCEAQALETLTAKGFSNSFEAFSEIMHDETEDFDTRTASEILFWAKVWRQSKTKEEVVTAWERILILIKNSNYKKIVSFDEGSASSEGFDERVDLPATERILELTEEGLTPEAIIMRGFSFEKVAEAFKYDA